jgi:hypothetical protein
MQDAVRLRIKAAGRFTPPTSQLSEEERALVFRAVQSVIEADGLLAQPGASLLLTLRSELALEGLPELGVELNAEDLREARLSPAAADYLCYMALLAGYANGSLSESQDEVIGDLCEAMGIRPERREEIRAACQRAILEANILMNLSDVIASSDLARRFSQELGLDIESLESVAEMILESVTEA